MGAVAEGLVVGTFASAQIDGAGYLRHEAVRLQARALVRSVAEWLFGGSPAGAPEVCLPRLERHLIGALLGTDRLLRHVFTPLPWTTACGGGLRRRLAWRRPPRSGLAGAQMAPTARQVTLSVCLSTMV